MESGLAGSNAGTCFYLHKFCFQWLASDQGILQMREYRYKHVLDEVQLRYDPDSRRYFCTFRKIIKNLTDRPLDRIYARIMVCGFPTDLTLATQHHSIHPISLDSIGYRCIDGNGTPLHTTVAYSEPSNLELYIWFKDGETGRPFSLEGGEEKELTYHFSVPDDLWGPFLLRHVRWPIDKVIVKLEFPDDLVSVWSEMLGVSSEWPAIDPPIRRKVGPSELWETVPADLCESQSSTSAGWQYREWTVTDPPVGSFFRFRWKFQDGRYEATRDLIRARYASDAFTGGVTVGATSEQARRYIESGQVHPETDFRSLFWFGEWYEFTPAQARCLEILWNAWKSGSPGISGDVLLEEAECRTPKLSGLFRRSRAWQDGVIHSPRKGLYSLQPRSNQ